MRPHTVPWWCTQAAPRRCFSAVQSGGLPTRSRVWKIHESHSEPVSTDRRETDAVSPGTKPTDIPEEVLSAPPTAPHDQRKTRRERWLSSGEHESFLS